MGVIRRDKDPRPIRIEDSEEFNYADYDLTESDTDSVGNNNVVLVSAASRSQKKKECRESRRLRRFHDALETCGAPLQKHMGARKWRRYENAKLLLSLVDKEDVVDDFSDMIQRSNTAFDQLFSDTAKMAVWNDFIEKDEAEQARILDEARTITRMPAPPASKPGSWFVVGGRPMTPEKVKRREEGAGDRKESPLAAKKPEDKRQHHPAYSASSCFARMDGKLRSFLSARNQHWALIDRADRELRDFFNSTPDAMWRRLIGTSRDRLALHAVAQFLMLKSNSRKEEHGTFIEVENKRAFFVPPHSLLVPYLATKRKAPIEFVPNMKWESEEDAAGLLILTEKTAGDEDTTPSAESYSCPSESSLDSSIEILDDEVPDQA